MQSKYCFLNGQIIESQNASISLSDIGLLRAYGVYDGITSFKGKPFLWSNHYDRFLNSARALNISIPFSKEDLYQKLIELLEKNEIKDRSIIRAIATAGETIAGIDFKENQSTVYFTVEPFSPLPKEYSESGAKLITHEYQREFPEYKTINYITGVMLQKKLKKVEAVEVLYIKNRKVLECATSNIVIVKDGKMISPSKDVLPGITKKLIFKLAKENSFEVEEREILVDELGQVDEVFITSSFKDIVPIVSIDEKTVGDGEVGEATKKLMEIFNEYIESGVGLDLETSL